MISMKGTVMKNKPLLSVIVPIYNGQKHLSETIKSIINSTYYEMEILLIDDGSSDNSSKICKKFSEIDHRIRNIRKENEGITATRNVGLMAALGEFVCFCDQDDIVAEEFYEVIMIKLMSTVADMGICSTGRLLGNHRILYEKMTDGFFSKAEIRKKILYPLIFRGYDYPFISKEHYLYGTIWKCIFRKSFLIAKDFKFMSFINYEDDWLFFMKALIYAENIVTIKQIGYYWRYDFNSKSHKRHYIENYISNLEKLNDYIKKLVQEANMPKRIENEYWKIQFCQNLQDLFDNYALLGKNKNLIRKKEISCIKKYMNENRYRENLTCINRLQICSIRRRLLYKLLKKEYIKSALFCNEISFYLEILGNRSFFIAKLDRFVKEICSK